MTLRSGILCLMVVCAGCAAAPAEPVSPAAAAVARAEAKYTESAARGFAWTATKQALDDARAALAAGDEATAETQAGRAQRLADASLEQADREASAWQERAPFDN